MLRGFVKITEGGEGKGWWCEDRGGSEGQGMGMGFDQNTLHACMRFSSSNNTNTKTLHIPGGEAEVWLYEKSINFKKSFQVGGERSWAGHRLKETREAAAVDNVLSGTERWGNSWRY